MADLNEMIAKYGKVLDEVKTAITDGETKNSSRLADLTNQFASVQKELEDVKEGLVKAQRQAVEEAKAEGPFSDLICKNAGIVALFEKKTGSSAPIHLPVNPLDLKAITYAPSPGTRTVSSDIRQWGALYNYPNILADPLRPMAIRDRLNKVSTKDQFIQYPRETSLTNSYAVVAETNSKPESAMAFVLEQTPIQTIASWIPAPLQLMDDMPRFQNYVETRMLDMLRVFTDRQYLYGAGGGTAINGILTDSGIQTLTQANGQNRYETVREAMVMIEETFYTADTLVIHPRDRYRMEIQKGSGDGQYILMPMLGAAGASEVLRIPVISSTVINEGTALLGNFQRGATLFIRDGVSVRVSFEHSDYFIKNMMALLVECREQIVVEHPKMFVKITWLGTDY